MISPPCLLQAVSGFVPNLHHFTVNESLSIICCWCVLSRRHGWGEWSWRGGGADSGHGVHGGSRRRSRSALRDTSISSSLSG